MHGSGATWVNGHVVAAGEAVVSAFDHGLLTGDGVFETLRVYRGAPFAARRHLDRLATSAAGMGLALPEEGVLRSAMASVISSSGLADGRLRITVTGGPSPLGSQRGAEAPTVIVAGAATAAGPPDPEHVVVVPWPRNDRGALAGLKSISYGENVVALGYARARGGGEAIFANLSGDLCEGSGTNVFVAMGGRLVTPPLSAGCLAGVTRDLLIDLVDVDEVAVPLPALRDADEAFLSSSTREVQPIASVDGRLLPAAPGPLTKAAAEAFAWLVARDLDP